MDISVLASVGSFMVSEHVLKPKASVLLVLGCVLAYDLTTKTHDVSSLRCYRGPCLLAFSLSMVAWSLRTWRRNGVACDELLFLPGTPHADHTIGDETHIGLSSSSSQVSVGRRMPSASSAVAEQQQDAESTNSEGENNVENGKTPLHRSEGDVAAGVGPWTQSRETKMLIHRHSLNRDELLGGRSSQHQRQEGVEMMPLNDRINEIQPDNYGHSRESSISSIDEFTDGWDEDAAIRKVSDDDMVRQVIGNEEENLMVPLTNSDRGERTRGSAQSPTSTTENNAEHTTAGDRMRAIRSHVVHDFREGQAQITRIGSLFFFRSTTTSTQNAAYAPSGPMVVGAALDLSMPILFNFHLFIEAWNHLDANGSETPAKILPLCFLTALTVRLVVPFGRRFRFWGTMKYTFTAPFNRSRFRDSFVGDVLTSLVRPLQDVVFAGAYYVTGVWGLISSKYDLSQSSEMVELSWILHTVILPSCALLPLWWKFLQTLRESYDTGRRWPYLGNAFKYLSAALVIMYGMTHPEERKSLEWLTAFFLTLLYQIWWDTFMDWELFVFVPRTEEGLDAIVNSSCCARISSVRPSSYILLEFQRYILNPFREAIRCALLRIPSWRQFQIRPRRLYKSEKFYWRIFFFNLIFRFTWMISFIPAYSLTHSRRDPKEEFESDTNSYIGVLLPVTEILRRTLWGFLLLEMQTIHMTDGDPNFQYAFSSSSSHVVGNTEVMQDEGSEFSTESTSKRYVYNNHFLPSWLHNQQQLQDHAAHSTPSAFLSSISSWVMEYLNVSQSTRDKLFFAELCIWASAFVGLGLWATAE